MLSHEKLVVYQKSIEFLAVVINVAQKFPRGYAPVSDQLRRASMSIPLNIAEASGRECGAVFDVCKQLAIIEDESFGKGKDLLHAIVGMLSKLCMK